MGIMGQPLNPKHAETAVAGLESYIAQLERDRADIEKKLEASREALKALQRQCNANGSSGRGNVSRRKRGENLRLVREEFARSPDGFTVATLAATLKLSPSSVQNVLKNNPAEFHQTADGLWRRTEEIAA